MSDREILKALYDHLKRTAATAATLVVDAICYGGPQRQYADVQDEAKRALALIPESFRNEMEYEDMRAEAARLRAKADKLESRDE